MNTTLIAANGTSTPAIIHTYLSRAEIDDVENVWFPFLVNATQSLLQMGVPVNDLPEHKHWMWSRKAKRYHGIPGYVFTGVYCAGEAEGLMLINTVRVCRLPQQRQDPMVYVDYLSTAPWNLRPLVAIPRFRGVGKALLHAAVIHSRDNGMAGRVGLHSLPQAELFYRDVCGMTDLGEDPNEYDLRYFEMTETQADAFLLTV